MGNNIGEKNDPKFSAVSYSFFSPETLALTMLLKMNWSMCPLETLASPGTTLKVSMAVLLHKTSGGKTQELSSPTNKCLEIWHNQC